MERVLAALERLESGQSSARVDMTALRVDLMARMDRLDNRLTGIQDDIAVAMGAADAGRRVNANTREEVRDLGEVVSRMQRQIMRIKTDVDQMRDGKAAS